MGDTKSKYNETILPLPMYSMLPVQDQLKIFQQSPFGKRKVVFSTNIAETSITIQNIVYVIDSGLCKMNYYHQDHRIDLLIVTKISKESAIQRAGRAGRTKPGKIYRLYSEEEYESLEPKTIPEIQRCNMVPVILQMKALGIDNILRFGFVSRPSSKLMANGLQLLHALKLIDDKCNLTTPLGASVCEFPLNPMISTMLYLSGDFGCSEEITTISAFLQIENIYYIPPNKKREADRVRMRFASKEGDHISFINIYRSFLENKKNPAWCKRNFLNYKDQIRSNLVQLLKKYNIPLISSNDDDIPVRKCICAGFFSCVARFTSTGEYQTLGSSKPLHIHQHSVLCYDVPPDWVIYNQVISGSKDYMRDIDPNWLMEVAPHYYQYESGLQTEML